MSKDRLLSDEELLDEINRRHLAHHSDDPAYQLNGINYTILELVQTQKRLYAESVINSLIEKDAFDEKFELKELIKSIREVMRIK